MLGGQRSALWPAGGPCNLPTAGHMVAGSQQERQQPGVLGPGLSYLTFGRDPGSEPQSREPLVAGRETAPSARVPDLPRGGCGYFGEIPTEPGDQDETLRGPGPAPSHMGETEGQSREEATQRAGPHHLPGEGSALPRPQFTVCEVGFGRHVCVKDQGDHGWGAAPPPISGLAAADPHSTQSLGGGGLAALGWRTCRSPGRSRPQPPGPAVLVGLEGVDVVQGAAVPGVPSGGCEVNGHLQGPQCEDPGTPPSWAGVGTCTPL